VRHVEPEGRDVDGRRRAETAGFFGVRADRSPERLEEVFRLA